MPQSSVDAFELFTPGHIRAVKFNLIEHPSIRRTIDQPSPMMRVHTDYRKSPALSACRPTSTKTVGLPRSG